MKCTAVIIASSLAVLNAQEQTTTVKIAMSTSYTGSLICNFNSNSHPLGGTCHETASGLLGPCPGFAQVHTGRWCSPNNHATNHHPGTC